ncbi:MAG: SUMF1/EgtB/PvdO family nonheme iron enzyme [Candidatus Contendobacter sp.]|nr:SUMF1/EgtB/PvdO family nonheme iron enzyme [Candidatus Contendobacter sp.]
MLTIQTQRIFLASSSELKEDRREFEIFINRKNRDWIAKGVFLELVLWEDFLDAMSQTRLQDEYNQAIRQCDVFVMLFFTKVGKYTAEEFETAFGQFKATNKPFIFTYFKDAEISTGTANKKDLMSLWAFQEKLDALGHFYTRYQNIDALKHHFNQQLDKLAASGFIEFKSDKGDAAAAGGNTYQATVTGGGAIAQGPGATAAGAGGVAIGGNHTGNINTGAQTNVDTGGGAYVGGNVNTGGGKFVSRDDRSKVEHHYHGVTPVDAEQAEAIYRRCIADRCKDLPLQDVGDSSTGGESESLSLAEVYIGLDTRRNAPVEAIDRALANAAQGRFDGLALLQSAKPSAPRDADARAVSALEAAILNRHLVLTGEPGSGKSTFVDHLTHALALQRWECLLDWPERERNALPILVILRDFAHWLGEREKSVQAGANLLWDYIRHDLGQWRLSSAAGVLEKALEDGRAVVLLDGLDEVPADDEARLTLVKDSVQRFVERYRHDRHLVTCRVLSYQESHWRLPERTFPDVELARFTEEQIDRFITAWYREVGSKWRRLSPADIPVLAGKLRRAVRRKELWRLAPNPLLLTVMALVHSQKRELPEKRALLYSAAVDILLQDRAPDKRLKAPQLRELLDEVDRDFNDLKAVLEQLAFDTHGGGAVRDAEDGAPIDTLTLLERVASLHPKASHDWAKRLLKSLELRSSLLLGRNNRVYSFPHRTFQEFLAGVHLARFEGDQFAREAARLAGELPTYWREVVLLAVGYLVHSQIRDTGKPRLLVEELCPERAPGTDLDWRGAWLAGDVLWEMGVNRVRDTAHGQRLLERVTNRLAALVEQGLLSARERAEAGDVLGRLGDPRPGVGVIPGTDIPDLDWVDVPAGPFTMGSPKGDQDAYDGEKPAHRLELPGFQISRYPITNAQYRPFVEAEGYHQEQWWTDTGRAWRRGAEADLSFIDDENLRKQYVDWLAGRPMARRDRPFWWDDPQWGAATRPVVGVTRHEAVAYCHWLTVRLREVGKLAKNASVRLPNEAEWEKAARGPDGRRWPWGNDWEEDRANTQEAGLGQTSPVGLFPQGASPYGVHDLAGNVWEWTGSLWGRTSIRRPDYRYPYDPHDGRNVEDADAPFVVRGGSWNYDRQYARAAYRFRVLPGDFINYLGIRVVVSLANSEF